MVKHAMDGAIRVGRAVSAMFGLALMMALVVGVGTTALAAVPGDPFKLGRVNVVDGALTALKGARAGGAVMLVDNDSSAAGSRALDLRAQPGRAPLTVNPDAGKATNLDADRLDGKDSTAFFSGKTYIAERMLRGQAGGTTTLVSVICDQGDRAVGGGGSVGNTLEDDLVQSMPTGFGSGWQVIVQDNGAPNNVFAHAVCADFPPLR